MTTPEHTKDLATVNTKIIATGEQLPAVKLKDGTTVQTGTVATALHNIAETMAQPVNEGGFNQNLERSIGNRWTRACFAQYVSNH